MTHIDEDKRALDIMIASVVELYFRGGRCARNISEISDLSDIVSMRLSRLFVSRPTIALYENFLPPSNVPNDLKELIMQCVKVMETMRQELDQQDQGHNNESIAYSFELYVRAKIKTIVWENTYKQCAFQASAK